MNINKLIVVGAGLALAGCCCKPPCCQNSVVGNWSAKLPYDDMFAGSFIFSRGADGAAKAFVLWR